MVQLPAAHPDTFDAAVAASTPQPNSLQGWTQSLAAVSDPIRLRLLHLLEAHELGVSELCDVTQLPQSTVSRHLKVLGEDHWVVSRRQGTTNRYRMLLDELSATQRAIWLLSRQQTTGGATLEQDGLRLTRVLERQAGPAGFFDQAADAWDQTREELYGRSFTTRSFAGLLPDHYTVVDLGCGTGSTLADLAPWVTQVIGIDRSKPMLEAAAARTADLPNVDLHHGDLEALPIPDQSADAALLILVLAYLDDPAPVLAEMHRILKPGGIALVIDLLEHERDDFRRDMEQVRCGFAPAHLTNLLTSAGFTTPRAHPLPPEPHTKGPALLMATAYKPGHRN
ncbi:MAG: metalloregulator ArsR/SmtB family transcription factor [Planctomycetota bacterium]